MAYLGKDFAFESQENIEEFIEALGLPVEIGTFLLNFKPNTRLEKDGDTYTLTTQNPDSENALEVSFEDGTEKEATLGETKIKSTYKVEGDSVIQTQTFNDEKSITITNEFSDDELIVTISSSFWDGTAKRVYKPA